ncbi:MAG: hypothetical protein ACJ8BW_03425 [Ktedonobacteraceae bacterium]
MTTIEPVRKDEPYCDIHLGAVSIRYEKLSFESTALLNEREEVVIGEGSALANAVSPTS